LDGYFGPLTNVAYPDVASQNVTVDPQQPAPETTLWLVRGGTISGRVRDWEGKLVPNINVSANVLTSNGSWRAIVSKSTDDRGEYRLFTLPPGEYYVAAGVSVPAGGVVRYFVGWTAAGPAGPASAVPGQTFFPSATTPSDATPVVLKEGEDVVNIDINVRLPLPTDAPLRTPRAPEDKILHTAPGPR
jgi:hypothetical protein